MTGPRPAACFLMALLSFTTTACFDTHAPAPAPDASLGVDPSRSDPTDPVPPCTTTCENHLGSLCASPTEGLCTCSPRGNSGKGKWDCLADWSGTAACPAGADHGTACPRAIASIDQACQGGASDQICYCGGRMAWVCGVLAR